MKADMVITRDGKISIFTREGNFDLGKANIEALLSYLEAEGIDIEMIGDVEQHRHVHETVREEVLDRERKSQNPGMG